MNASFLFYWPAWLVGLCVFFMILIFIWLGTLFRGYIQRRRAKLELKELGSLENSMLGLLGLLLAFTFGISLEKFNERRRVIVEEGNAIGTAILRADLYADSVRAKLREEFQHYVETRISYYDAGINEKKIRISSIYLQDANSNVYCNMVSIISERTYLM